MNNNNSVTLDWNDCRGVSGYAVYFRASPLAPFTLLASGFTNTALTVTNLPATGIGEWMVRSLGDPGSGFDGPLWHFGFAPPRLDDVDGDGIPDSWEREYFGVLSAVNGTTDRDNDRSKDWQEWVAGTNPTNRLDLFGIGTCRAGLVNPALGVPSTVLEWRSAIGRTYTIYYTTQLQHQTTVWTLLDQVSGTGGTVSYTNAWPDPVGFYFMEVTAGPQPASAGFMVGPPQALIPGKRTAPGRGASARW